MIVSVARSATIDRMQSHHESQNPDSPAEVLSVTLGKAMRADRPCTLPSQDRFGFVPTARAIARTLRQAPAPTGLVLHIDGLWGSGKSSMLGLVEHVLKSESETGDSPVLQVRFNPWWFADHEHLAHQFLEEFRKQLIHESKRLLDIGNLIASYADTLGGVMATGASALGAPVPAGIFAAFFRRLARKKRDVVALKEEISAKLRNADQRIVVFIDDVDRLTPPEINQLFRVVKAVADFPNVVYVLAFDREEVARALNSELRVDGAAYLEKIVQVPFVLPTLRQDTLRDLLVEDVRRSAPEVRFEPSPDQYDANVLFAAGDLLRRPRDLVRFANAFAPTYAGLRDDVMAVDVAALELLRVVEPRVYRAIRDHGHRFLEGPGNLQLKRSDLDPRDVDWNEGMSDTRRASVVRLLDRLFPQRTRRTYSSAEIQRWETQGRVCSGRGYTTYFQQQRPDDKISPREVDEILEFSDALRLTTVWRELAAVERPGHNSKAIDLLAELRNVDDFTSAFGRALFVAVMDSGDLVFQQARDGEPIEWLMWNAAVKCIDAMGESAVDDAIDVVKSARALYSMVTIVRYILESSDRSSEHYDPKLSNIGDQGADRLRLSALACIERSVSEQTLLSAPKLPHILESWKSWSVTAPMVANEWVGELLGDDESLLALMKTFISWATSYQLHDAFVTRIPRFELDRFLTVLPLGVDLAQIEMRLARIESRRYGMSDAQKQTIKLFRSSVRALDK